MIYVPADTRPVLLGMDNPLSSAPEHALYPHPPGCTGWRLYDMLRERLPGVTRGQYLRAFDRRNLCEEKWSIRAARDRGRWLTRELQGREVVVLGAQPRSALGLPELLIEPQDRDGVTWRQIPHPSGRNLWYNDPGHRQMVAVLLEQLFKSVKLRENN